VVKLSLQTVHNFTPVYPLSLPLKVSNPLRKRVKVEFQDGQGTKYSLAVEGRISREKVLKIMDLMELVDGTDGIEEPVPSETSTFGRVFKIIESSYAGKEFSSADIAREYEDLYSQPIALSTISTYLSRFAERGTLKRQKFGNSWVYRRVHLAVGQLPLK
jgi:hypothetical protein